MAKKRRENDLKSGIVKEVFRRLEERREPVRTNRTLVLHKDNYERFDKVCRERNLFPSKVIDEFIALFLEEAGE